MNDAKAAIEHKLPLPNGHSLEWGGQYENQKRAQQRLAIVFPISVLIIAALLYATFHDLKQMLLILLIVPLALIGGIAALWIRGINLNLSASVGLFALFGIAVLNGVVMVRHINSLRKQGKDLDEVVHQGASDRLRPVLITAMVARLGFIHMALATSRGAEVEKPLATVIVSFSFAQDSSLLSDADRFGVCVKNSSSVCGSRPVRARMVSVALKYSSLLRKYCQRCDR